MSVMLGMPLLTNHIAAFEFWNSMVLVLLTRWLLWGLYHCWPITLQHLNFEIQWFLYCSLGGCCEDYTTVDQSHCSIWILKFNGPCITQLTNHIAAFEFWNSMVIVLLTRWQLWGVYHCWPITLQHLNFEIQWFLYCSLGGSCEEYTTADQSHCSIWILKFNGSCIAH